MNFTGICLVNEFEKIVWFLCRGGDEGGIIYLAVYNE
jgi:hypothetical protein